MSDYECYPGGERFEPWQDQEWPFHCSVPARYLGEIGEREIAKLSGSKVEEYVLQHDVYEDDPPIIAEMIPAARAG
jgi:uncharacterized protein CbrC (UPF0167 family)